jgi:hypothetical protein
MVGCCEVKTRSRKREWISPSVWRSASRKTARSVSAVVIANAEWRGWPPRVQRGSASHPAIAASVNQTVRLRWRKAIS